VPTAGEIADLVRLARVRSLRFAPATPRGANTNLNKRDRTSSTAGTNMTATSTLAKPHRITH